MIATSSGVRAGGRERYAAPVTDLGLWLHQDMLAVVRLSPEQAVPSWGAHGLLSSVTRTDGELSIVCGWSTVPDDTPKVGPWRAFAVVGPLDFSLVGVLARLTAILADAGIPVFVISTHDTDWILVRAERADAAGAAFEAAGVSVATAGQDASDVT